MMNILLKARKRLLAMMIPMGMALGLILSPVIAHADSDDTDVYGVPNKITESSEIFDPDDVISSSEEKTILKKFKAIDEKYDVNVYAVITYEIGGSGRVDDYLEYDFYKKLPDLNAVVVVIGLEENNHWFQLHSYGNDGETSAECLDTDRLNSIQDKMKGYLSSGEYAQALITYADDISYYLGKGDASFDSLFFKGWFQFLLVLVIVSIVICIKAFSSGQKVTTTPATYLDQKQSRVLRHFDRYTHTTVTRTKIESSSSSGGGGGGGGGGGSSSSGSSF